MPTTPRLRTAFVSSLLVCAATGVQATELDPAPDSQAVAATIAMPAETPSVEPPPGILRRWLGAIRKPVESEPIVLAPSPTIIEAGSPLTATARRAGDLVVHALGLLGIHYRRGGTSPEAGFDCSGMVRYVFQNAVGMDLPHRAEEISRLGAKVDRNELKPGDLVFYNTLRRTFSHVGIYLGNNRFIHAPSAGGAVRVEDMSQSYWAARFSGARRVEP